MRLEKRIADFLAQKKIAVVGASRRRYKFGNKILLDLECRGYQVYPINPLAEEIEGIPCFPNLLAVPDQLDGVVFIVPPVETEKVLKDVLTAKIPRVWLQQGSESALALQFCEENDISVISGVCILMV